ncbi:MAG: molybdopterin-guanine dinucleotide biosynthesis protein B [Rhodospirillales bacterium]|nr:molybdopterin-guanine dinucleotide biosynthesis protein B [Rhodospirillales bacterium]
MEQKVFGLVGWSGSGKTTLVTRLLPELTNRGLSVSTVKHTHHDIEVDKPGKDSFRHRKSGAVEVLITSPVRWALVHELREAPEPEMTELIGRMGPVDIILVEGFKSHPYPKLEIHRPSTGKALLADNDETVVAVASDEKIEGLDIPVLELSDMGQIAKFIIEHCQLNPVSENGADD